MALIDDIKSHAAKTFREQWDERSGKVIPDPSDLGMGNDAVKFERATVLYADLDQSTALVEDHTWSFSAEVYKAFLYASSRLIRQAGGSIVSYDGDRVMGVFIGNSQTSSAADCGLKINYAVSHVLQPALRAVYTGSGFTIRHVVGIDTGVIRAARTGVRGDNDLVWVGNAPNVAAKLTALSSDYPTRITGRAYDRMHRDQKYGGTPEQLMWQERTWTDMDGMRMYRSSWWRSF